MGKSIYCKFLLVTDKCFHRFLLLLPPPVPTKVLTVDNQGKIGKQLVDLLKKNAGKLSKKEKQELWSFFK